MSSYTILFLLLLFIALLKPLETSAVTSDLFSFSPSEEIPDLDQLWSTDDTLDFASLGATSNECTLFDTGLVGKVRARELCSNLLPSSNDDELFASEELSSINGADSYDGAISYQPFNPGQSSDLALSVGGNCHASNFGSTEKLQARNEECRNTQVIPIKPGWDPNLEDGIYKQGHPDGVFLKGLEWAPLENNEEYCPAEFVGNRYAVCGPNNEVADVIGYGVTLRNCDLFVGGLTSCFFPRDLWCCQYFYQLKIGGVWKSFAHYCIRIRTYRDMGLFW